MDIILTTQNTTLLNWALGVLTALWAIMVVFVFAGVKTTYARNGTFTNKLLSWWFAMWGIYFAALILSSLYGVWLIPIDQISARISGLVLIFAGVVLLTIGMTEFRTLHRSCGQDVSRLITTGVYRWSRNPQFIGCLLSLIGLSLAGRSMFSFALTAMASIVISWYTVYLAEPYLERLYGEEYESYKKRVARWIGFPHA